MIVVYLLLRVLYEINMTCSRWHRPLGVGCAAHLLRGGSYCDSGNLAKDNMTLGCDEIDQSLGHPSLGCVASRDEKKPRTPLEDNLSKHQEQVSAAIRTRSVYEQAKGNTQYLQT